MGMKVYEIGSDDPKLLFWILRNNIFIVMVVDSHDPFNFVCFVWVLSSGCFILSSFYNLSECIKSSKHKNYKFYEYPNFQKNKISSCMHEFLTCVVQIIYQEKELMLYQDYCICGVYLGRNLLYMLVKNIKN